MWTNPALNLHLIQCAPNQPFSVFSFIALIKCYINPFVQPVPWWHDQLYTVVTVVPERVNGVKVGPYTAGLKRHHNTVYKRAVYFHNVIWSAPREMSSEYCEEEQMHKVKNVLIVTFVVYGVLEMHSMTKTIYCTCFASLSFMVILGRKNKKKEWALNKLQRYAYVLDTSGFSFKCTHPG